MATIYKGTTLVEGPMTSTWKVGTGGQSRRQFKGTASEINAKAIELQLLGYETEITTGPAYSLTATINIDLITNPGGTEPEPVPQWELIPHNIDQSIYECGRAFVKDLPATVKAAIEAKLKNPQNPNLFVVPTSYLNDNTMIEKAMRIYTMKQGGIDGRRICAVSLRRTIIASTYYNPSWSITNNLKVFSTGNLISTYGVPNVISVLMPASGDDQEVVTFDDVAVQQITFPWYLGWLEQRPSYQIVSVNRISISQEWIYNRWLVGDTGLYDLIG